MSLSRRALAATAAAVAVLALVLDSCGKDALSAPALRRDATRVCMLAKRRLSAIDVPRSPRAAEGYLTRGAAALEPELTTLRQLDPPSAATAPYERGLDALSEELATLRSAAAQIDHGTDPIAAFRTLQAQLGPIEARADAAFHTLDVEACAGG